MRWMDSMQDGRKWLGKKAEAEAEVESTREEMVVERMQGSWDMEKKQLFLSWSCGRVVLSALVS